jgi:hypothetical protein
MIMDNYCKALDAGDESDPDTVAERLTRLLNTLDEEITAYVASGALVDDVRELKLKMISSLRADGWKVILKNSGRWIVIAPG